jgi:hypothetical protein
MWIGGAISRAAGTGLVIGVFIVIFGATPGQIFADLFTEPPKSRKRGRFYINEKKQKIEPSPFRLLELCMHSDRLT